MPTLTFCRCLKVSGLEELLCPFFHLFLLPPVSFFDSSRGFGLDLHGRHRGCHVTELVGR